MLSQTASAVQTFFLAMAMFPEVQKMAQAELDTVIGRERLPDFNDSESLPYINAVVKETLRWQPVLPVGEPCFLNGQHTKLIHSAQGFLITLRGTTSTTVTFSRRAVWL